MARADAEIARKVMAQLEEARGRQPVASVAPVALLDRSNLVPLAGGAVAILLLGMWLGGRVAHRRAALAVGVTAVGLQALEPMPSAPEPAGAVDQDRLVEALGKELGVQEPATPKDSAPDATPLTPAADAPVTANGPVVAAPPATPAAPTAPALPAPPETKTEVSASR